MVTPIFSLPQIQSSPVSRMLQLIEEIPHHFKPISLRRFLARIEWPKLLWLILCLELCIWNGQFGSFPVFQKVVAARNPSINCRFTVDQMGPAWVWLSAAEMQCSWPSHPRHFQSDHPANNSSIKMYKMDSTN